MVGVGVKRYRFAGDAEVDGCKMYHNYKATRGYIDCMRDKSNAAQSWFKTKGVQIVCGNGEQASHIEHIGTGGLISDGVDTADHLQTLFAIATGFGYNAFDTNHGDKESYMRLALGRMSETAMITNNNDLPVRVVIRAIRSKKNNDVQMASTWNSGLSAEDGISDPSDNTTLSNAFSAATPFAYPQQSSQFKEYFDVFATKNIILKPGGSYEVCMDVGINRILSAAMLKDATVFVGGVTHSLMVTIMGLPASSARIQAYEARVVNGQNIPAIVGVEPSVTTAKARVDMVLTRKFNFKVVPQVGPIKFLTNRLIQAGPYDATLRFKGFADNDVQRLDDRVRGIVDDFPGVLEPEE